MRWTRQAATLSAFMATGLVLPACQTPSAFAPSLSAAAPALGDADFRADGVSRREIVVRLASRAAALPKSFKTKWSLPSLGAAVVDVPATQSPEQTVAALKKVSGVRYADVVRQVEVGDPAVEDRPYYARPAATGGYSVLANFFPASNDPRFGEQYGLKLVKAPEAWQISPGDSRTLLAIVDSGIDITHPDLRSQVARSYNAVTKSPEVTDRKGHGTHTSGIAVAAAGNSEGGSGVAPGCRLLAVQISSQGLGKTGRSSDVLAAEGIVWAVDNGAKVVSMSFGFYRRSRILEDALQYALDKDVVLVASAGNNNAENDPETAPHLPSTHPGVIEVAAVDREARKAEFSNFGRTVTIAAPGVDVLSSIPGGYKTKSGTSMAAPHVAGVAALVRSRFPELDRAAVKARLEQTAVDLGDPGVDEIFGAGLVDAAAAVRDLAVKPALR